MTGAQWALGRQAVEDLLGEYSLACDERDRAVLVDLFEPDATATYDDDPTLAGGTVIADWIMASTAALLWQQHLISAARCRIDDDHATVVANLVSHQVTRDAPEQLHRMLSRYDVELRWRDGRWRIADLVLTVGVHQNEPVTVAHPR